MRLFGMALAADSPRRPGWCQGSAPMPKLLGLYALLPAHGAKIPNAKPLRDPWADLQASRTRPQRSSNPLPSEPRRPWRAGRKPPPRTDGTLRPAYEIPECSAFWPRQNSVRCVHTGAVFRSDFVRGKNSFQPSVRRGIDLLTDLRNSGAPRPTACNSRPGLATISLRRD
jgi:hypothetical protein